MPHISRNGIVESITSLLSILSPRQREAYELKSQGKTRQEVAEAMGVEPSYVKNLWQEGRRRIRRKHPEVKPHAQTQKPTRLRLMQMSALASPI